MDPASDFVVVEEDESCAQKALMDRLSVLVDLFSKALDAVNQSNVLLKDELRSALSVTLRNIGPDTSASTEALVRALESSVTSTDDVRANYTRNLCSRLVAVNEQNETLSAELSSLKQSIQSKDKDHEDQLRIVSSTVERIYEALRSFESQESSGSNSTGNTEIRSLDELNISLNDIKDRVAALNLTVKEPQVTKDTSTQPVEHFAQTNTQTAEKGSITAPAQSERSIQTDDLPSVVPTLPQPELLEDQPPTRTSPSAQPVAANQSVVYGLSKSGLTKVGAGLRHLIQEVAERSGPFDYRTHSGSPSPLPPQTEPQPTFSAQQEEPWCPCCGQTFDTRDELESHLQQCLQ